jgi:pteridine reductase
MSLQTPNSRGLIAGGTGRIGRAITTRLESDGWLVFAAGRGDGDLRTAAGARAVVDSALATLGGLDLVVHAAGDGFSPKPVEQVTEADWDAAMDVTAKGTFFLAQAAAAALRESRGVIVIVEDVAAFRPWAAFAPHSAAKAAQSMLVRTLALAFAPEVRVCGVAPGAVAVDQGQEARRAAETLVGHIGRPEDVADAVAYLVGARFVTGTSLLVDGGTSLKSGGGTAP